MTWNYRATVCSVPTVGDESEEGWSVREVYYDDAGDVKSWSSEPACPWGDTREELALELARFTEALSKPALDLETGEWVTE